MLTYVKFPELLYNALFSILAHTSVVSRPCQGLTSHLDQHGGNALTKGTSPHE